MNSAQELVEYIVKPLTSHPDAVSVTLIEGTASLLMELRVHPEDIERVRGAGGKRLRALQQVLAAAGGSRKPVLDLMEHSQAEHSQAEHSQAEHSAAGAEE